jgi:hypothetical protein
MKNTGKSLLLKTKFSEKCDLGFKKAATLFSGGKHFA